MESNGNCDTTSDRKLCQQQNQAMTTLMTRRQLFLLSQPALKERRRLTCRTAHLVYMKDSWSPRTEGRRQGRAIRLVAGYLPSPSITVLAVWPLGSYLMTVQVDISEQCSFVGLHAVHKHICICYPSQSENINLLTRNSPSISNAPLMCFCDVMDV